MGRRHHQVWFRLAIIPLAVLTAISTPVALSSQQDVLDRLGGRDLWKDQPKQAESAELQRVVGSVSKGFMMEPVPWHIWKTTHNSQTRHVVLLGENLMIIPGGTSVTVQLFDQASTMIRSWSIQTGWRNELTDASLAYSTELDTDLLTIRTAPVINGRDIKEEYFAIGGSSLRLVRLEDSKGAAVQNEYVFPNYEIGIVPSAKSVQDWIGLLQSKDKADVLSALVFLGGQHLAGKERMMLPEPHESRYAALFQQLLADASIRDLITQLTKSDNEWIRDAAILASRGPRERPLR
jgi:hypothetical protein